MGDHLSDDKTTLVLGIAITTLSLSAIFVTARTLTRSVIKPQFGWDDTLIIVTWVPYLIFIYFSACTAMFVSISHGFGKHFTQLTLRHYKATVKAEIFTELLAILSFPTGKASVAYFLLRLFPGKKLKWLL